MDGVGQHLVTLQWLCILLVGRIQCRTEKPRGDEVIDQFRSQFAGTPPVGQFVASNLFQHKTVVWFIFIHRSNDVVPISPRFHANPVGCQIPIRIGVSRHVEPVPAPAFPMPRGTQHPVDQPLIGIGSGVTQELVNFPRRGWQTKHVKK